MDITSDSKYSIISILSILTLLFFLQAAHGDEGVWQGGHATFYGDADASGTMGMLMTNNNKHACYYNLVSFYMRIYVS